MKKRHLVATEVQAGVPHTIYSSLDRIKHPAIEVLKIRNPSEIAYCEVSSRGSCWDGVWLSTFVAIKGLRLKWYEI